MNFLETFPGIKLNNDQKLLFGEVEVTKIAHNKAHDVVRVYIDSDHMIPKEAVFSVEKIIKNQFFANKSAPVKIQERFILSDAYTPSKIYELYEESLMFEVKEYSKIIYRTLKSSTVSVFDDCTIKISLPDSFVARQSEAEIEDIFSKVFSNRFNLNVKIDIDCNVDISEANSLVKEKREEEFNKLVNERVSKLQNAYANNGSENVEGSDLAGVNTGDADAMNTGAVAAASATESGIDVNNKNGIANCNANIIVNNSEYQNANGDANINESNSTNKNENGNSNASAKSTINQNTNSNACGITNGNTKANTNSNLNKNTNSIANQSENQKAGTFKSAGKFDNSKGLYRQKRTFKTEEGMIYGRNFEGDVTSLSSDLYENDEIIIDVKIMSLDYRETKSGKYILSMNVTDYTDSILVKIFLSPEKKEEIEDQVKEGGFVRIKGIVEYSTWDKEIELTRVVGIKEIPDFTTKRKDNALEKRVELHLHTMMSDMDGFIDPKKIVKRAYEWGHKAVAITDHGVVQGFTDAFHAYQDLRNENKDSEKGFDFKIIYGMEGYIVDDLKELVKNDKGQSLDDTFVVFDLETTGLSKYKNNIIEIGAVKVEGGKITERYSTFVNPKEPIPYKIEKLTSINDNMLKDAPTIEDVLPQFLKFCEGAVLVAHNAEFDAGFIEENCKRLELPYDYTVVDTLSLSRILIANLKKHTLDKVAKELGVPLLSHHRAVDDAECTSGIFLKLCNILKKEHNVSKLRDINDFGAESDEHIRKLKSHHIILLAKNDIGRVNLYRLCSISHLKYFARQAKIPKSKLIKYREGIIVGSACEAGELYRAILDGKSDEEITKIAEFYDYLEIQPLGNNAFMVKKEGMDNDKAIFDSFEAIEDINKKIVNLGKSLNKPVVATCDAHFMDPEDEIYRRIVMTGKGFADADNQAPLFYRTTEEMLEEFKYLGEDKAKEVVITNTNLICDMIENIEPVRPDKCPPVIEDSDKTLREICYSKAHSMYGENLPDIVEKRLERELNSIISNGYAVMYIIAQKLVWKSNEDGYLVGSRGSVGSSFVATMAGITEVNPLKAHYYCKKCQYSDFDLKNVEHEEGCSGCDLPDATCPVCGEPLAKEGFNIPFETFLGFKGNKEPDIDLNFSGEYQSKAHDYTEVIFGKGQTYRAGTIGTLQDKTAFGFVKKYYEEHGVEKRTAEIDRIVQGCVGVRRTTGQHPGGIIVLPVGEDINSFTPVQHPADDINSNIITTHFDYHSIDHNLLKLDILGHDDPTMIRKLESLTGFDAKSVTFDDAEVLSLFESTKALGVTPEDIDCPLGSLGIPEFGTEFVIQMLQDTKPKTFSDLVRISGLSHGTDVWLGTAETVIKEGKATISTAICTRDDIMTYLIQKGLEPSLSFDIMEKVRKGKGIKDEWEAEMAAHDVPDWYIWCCKRIKYMFPKAHAVAYVMMAFRIAYFKINFPLAYYAAYFSIRASAFNYEMMCLGKARLLEHMEDYKKRHDSKELSAKEEDTLKDMKLVLEMYARGFEFTPIDIYVAKANDFQIIDGKLMPSFGSIDGMGDVAAEACEETRREGKYTSIQNFQRRTKINQKVCDKMEEMGMFEGMPKEDQMSIFDLIQ